MHSVKRLIEVDLPIKRISAHARREKSIRHGHISTLHIWWARRPLAACRAIICASLWLDPADENCPKNFRDLVKKTMLEWSSLERQIFLSAESRPIFESARKNPEKFDDPIALRKALLCFIADFANWDNSRVKEYLVTSRALTQSAHESLGGDSGTKPLVIDPFAGGGSIPLEAIRIGADAFASDLNPVAVLINKVILEYIPRYGQRLSAEVHKWGEWIKTESEKALSEFYPSEIDGSFPVAYLWARTIRCEGPGCGVDVPLIRSLWLVKKGIRAAALQIIPKAKEKRVELRIIVKEHGGWVNQDDKKIKIANPQFNGTVKRSSAICPCCGYTTPAENVRNQFIQRSGGADDARLIAVIIRNGDEQGVSFRLANEGDTIAFKKAAQCCQEKQERAPGSSLIPDEPLPYLRSIFNVSLLGIDEWGKLFNKRQALALITLIEKLDLVFKKLSDEPDKEFVRALMTCLAFAVDRCADYWSSLAVWSGEFVAHTFGRQALGIVWDYAEVNGFTKGSGNYEGAVEWICRVIEKIGDDFQASASVQQTSACNNPLPSDSAQVFFTDPPYYDAVPYADLSDFFYVWLKRMISHQHPELFTEKCTPKKGEIVQLSERNTIYAFKTRSYFETLMKDAMKEGRRVLEPNGIGIVVFAHKSTAGWETQIQAMIDAGWVVVASWPIDTERPGRLRANNSAALASSVHLVCRPRENPDGSIRTGEVGDWRDVLEELPKRIHEWMPRLADEGVVGADAIFACLGPALEIYSRYSKVEKANGEPVALKEYLEQVWAAVAKEALVLVFKGADASGFEPDARLTAMWLWTLQAGGNDQELDDSAADEESGDDEKPKSGKLKGGFTLEYDAARKIAQGLGANLEDLRGMVEVSGDQARLLPVGERAQTLFGKNAGKAETPKKKREAQLDLFEVIERAEDSSSGIRETKVEHLGETILDRIHQSMILFAANRGEALKRFLVEDGVGRDQRFWRLAQALSALYPSQTDEKRWVDGVLARKKGLGF